MHNQIAMGVVDGFENTQEEFATGPDVEGMPAAEDIERLAFNKIHDEERAAVDGGSGIEQVGDVGMIEVGEDLAFAAKTVEDSASPPNDGELA